MGNSHDSCNQGGNDCQQNKKGNNSAPPVYLLHLCLTGLFLRWILPRFHNIQCKLKSLPQGKTDGMILINYDQSVII